MSQNLKVSMFHPSNTLNPLPHSIELPQHGIAWSGDLSRTAAFLYFIALTLNQIQSCRGAC